MGPKKGKRDGDSNPVSPRDEDGNPVDDVAVDKVCEAFSEDCIHELLDAAREEIHEERIRSITIPFAACLSLNDSIRVSSWFEMGRDDGSVEARDDCDSLDWKLEAEPALGRIDTWARGSVPTKAPAKQDTFADVEHMIGEYSNSSVSIASRSSRGLFSPNRGGGSRGGNSRGGSRGGKRQKPASPVEFSPVLSIDLGQDGADITDGKLRGIKSDSGTLMDGKGQSPAELLKVLKADKEREAAKLKLERENEAAKNAESEAHETLMKSLANKNYTFDDDGSVIIVEQMDSKQLPPANGFEVGSQVFEVVEQDLGDGKASRRSPGSRRGKRGKKKPGSSQKKTRGAGKSYFTVSSVAQPALISTMTISAGVSLKEGRRGKSGPDVSSLPGKMSRREYDDKKKREEESYYASNGSSIAGYTNHNIDLDNQTVSTNETLTLDGTESVGDSPRPEYDFKLGEVDSLSGAKMAKKKAPATPEHYMEDAHDKLIKDPNWGQPHSGNDPSPIRLARKPNAKQREIVSQFCGGPNAKNRRDRMHPSAMIPNKERSHLPSPPLGYATGHGMEKTIAPATRSAGGGEFINDNLSVRSGDSLGNSKGENIVRISPRGVGFNAGDGGSGAGDRDSHDGKGMFPPLVSSSTGDSAAGKKFQRQQSILGTRNGGTIKEHSPLTSQVFGTN